MVSSAIKHKKCSEGLIEPDGYVAVTAIPSLAGHEIYIQDINNDGVAVGSSTAADGKRHAIRYTDVGGVQDLGALPGFGSISYASSVAADGAITGNAETVAGSGVLVGYRYTPADGMTAICPSACSAWDLNTQGQVVGLIVDSADATAWQAFVYAPAAGLQRLGTLGGTRSSASGINAAGVVVGNAQTAGMPASDVGHAFIWDATNGMRDLNTLAGNPRWELKTASDITATQIAGYGLHNGEGRAYLYDIGSRRVTDLGAAPDGGRVFGWALNVHGDVAGWADHGDHADEAVAYSANLGLRRLNDFVDPAAQWDLEQANSINDNGEVVGWGFHAGVASGFKMKMPLCARPR